MATLVLSVALARSTAQILAERSEAAVVGDEWSPPLPFGAAFDAAELGWQAEGAVPDFGL